MSAINDIKVIFFIVNTIVGLLTGLLSISIGIALAVLFERKALFPGGTAVPIAMNVIVGLILLGAAALGYAGAIRQNRIMLFVYTGVLVLEIVGDIWQIAQIVNMNIYLLTFWISHLGVVVLAIILAVILAVKACKQSNQGMILSPPPAAYTPVA